MPSWIELATKWLRSGHSRRTIVGPTRPRVVAMAIASVWPINDHFHDRLKMLLLSNRKGDIFEELDIHIAFAPGFVNLHEFSKLHAKIRGSTYC
jgi:hypothetical protein